MVPGDTPDALLAAVQKAVLQALAQPASRERRAGLDLSYEALAGVATSKRLSDLSARYAKIAKSHADGFTTCGIKVNRLADIHGIGPHLDGQCNLSNHVTRMGADHATAQDLAVAMGFRAAVEE